MMRIKAEIFDEISRKRPLEPQLLENAEAKRQRIVATLPAASMPQQREIPALGPGPHTLGEVFNLGPDNGVLDYDVGALSSEFIARLTVATLAGLDPIVLAKSIAVSPQLLLEFCQAGVLTAPRLF
jgi:symplekin